MKQKTRKPNPVTRLHTRVSKNKCPHESFQCGLTHSWIIKLASRVGSPTLYSDCIIMQEFLRLVACARGSRVRGHMLYEPSEANAAFCAKCECETSAKRYFSPPLVLRKMPRSPRLAWDYAPHWKKNEKKIDERSESFLTFFAPLSLVPG